MHYPWSFQVKFFAAEEWEVERYSQALNKFQVSFPLRGMSSLQPQLHAGLATPPQTATAVATHALDSLECCDKGSALLSTQGKSDQCPVKHKLILNQAIPEGLSQYKTDKVDDVSAQYQLDIST